MDRDVLVERMLDAFDPEWGTQTPGLRELRRHAMHRALAVTEPVIQADERERCAAVVEEAQAEVQANIDANIDEVRVLQMTPADNRPLIRARDWLRHTAAAIRAPTR